jgi:hypothetical protein
MPLPKKRPNSVPVKIPIGMYDWIADFRESDMAKKLGWDSKSDVVTEALRDFFKKYGLVPKE